MDRKKIIELMGWHQSAENSMSDIIARIERIVRYAESAESKACARIADTYGGPKEPMMVGDMEAGAYNTAEAIAADIRARGDK